MKGIGIAHLSPDSDFDGVFNEPPILR